MNWFSHAGDSLLRLCSLYSWSVNVNMGHWWNGDRVKCKYSRRNLSHCHLFYHKSHMGCSGTEYVSQSGTPATHLLTCGTLPECNENYVITLKFCFNLFRTLMNLRVEQPSDCNFVWASSLVLQPTDKETTRHTFLEDYVHWSLCQSKVLQPLRKPQVHYRFHRKLPQVHVLNQMNPVLWQINPHSGHSSTPKKLSILSYCQNYMTVLEVRKTPNPSDVVINFNVLR